MCAGKVKSLTVLAAFVVPGFALAQGFDISRQVPVEQLRHFPPEFGFAYHHASTAAEGGLRGRAELIHALGSYSVAASQSLLCREEARRLAIDNHDRWVARQISLRKLRESARQERLDTQ